MNKKADEQKKLTNRNSDDQKLHAVFRDAVFFGFRDVAA